MEDLTLYSLKDAKPRLGQLIKRAQGGEEIALTRYGSPAVVLVPIASYGKLVDAFLESVKRHAERGWGPPSRSGPAMG